MLYQGGLEFDGSIMTRSISYLLVFSFSFPLLGCTMSTSITGKGQTNALNEEGVECLNQHQLTKAHGKFVEAWKQDPTNADTLYNLASTYHRHGQLQEAERYYLQALKTNPDHALCRHNYYQLLVTEDRLSEAQADASKWVKQRPQSAIALTQLGWLTRLQGDLPTAQKQLEKSLALEPDNTETLLELGKLYQDLNLNDRAKGLYTRVLQIDPQQKEASNLLVSMRK